MMRRFILPLFLLLLSPWLIYAEPAAARPRKPPPVVETPPPETPHGVLIGDDWIDLQGRSFRVRFDPGHRVELGAGAAIATVNSEEVLFTTELRANIAARLFLVWGEDETLVSWLIDSAWLSGWMWPTERNADDVPAMSLSLYQGHYLRHSANPYIVFPSSPPKRVYFPFDVGVSVDLARLWVPAQSTRSLHLTTVEAYVLLDPWRSGQPGKSFEFGLGVRYDIDIEGDDAGFDAPEITHRVAPFTALTARLRWEDEMGRTALDVRGDLHPHWSSEGGWALTALSTAHFERILIAIHDEPIALTVDASYRFLPETPRSAAIHELRAMVGLSMLWQL